MANFKPAPPSNPHTYIRTSQVLQTTFIVAIVFATLFTAFSPSLFSNAYFNAMLARFMTPQQAAIAAVPTPEQIRIGIVSGHWGHDSGAVCDNGTT